MNREEMIDELIERVQEELDELTNDQLENILNEYKHLPLLSEIVEQIELEDDEDDVIDDADLELDDNWQDDEE